MRILFVTAHKHLPELRGGMEVNTHELALRLQQRGVEVGVLCGLAGKGWTGARARLQIKLLGKQCPVDRGLGYPVWRAWEGEQHVAKLAGEFKPDIIVVQGGSKFDTLVTSSLEAGVPVVCYLHTPDRLPLSEALLENPQLHFLANSEFTRSLHPEKRFKAIIRPLILPELYVTDTDRSSAVFINPAPHKGLQVVLDLASKRQDIDFLFVVNRSETRRKLAKEPAISSLANVRLLGPESDMREVYKRAKLVLAPSQWLETWGRIATEAHFSGIPVLASDRGGLPEAVGGGGLCLSVNASSDAWLSALNRIWDDAHFYATLAEEARAYARRSEINPDNIADQFMHALISSDSASYRS